MAVETYKMFMATYYISGKQFFEDTYKQIIILFIICQTNSLIMTQIAYTKQKHKHNYVTKFKKRGI